jgi:hypothetical protein
LYYVITAYRVEYMYLLGIPGIKLPWGRSLVAERLNAA